MLPTRRIPHIPERPRQDGTTIAQSNKIDTLKPMWICYPRVSLGTRANRCEREMRLKNPSFSLSLSLLTIIFSPGFREYPRRFAIIKRIYRQCMYPALRAALDVLSADMKKIITFSAMLMLR